MSQATNHIVMETKNLNIGYFTNKETISIAKNLHLQLHKGTLVCILGKNGSGKSTLLRTLAGIQAYIDGDILIDHKAINTYSSNALAHKISFVFTEKIPENLLLVSELITMGRQAHTNWLDSLTANDTKHINFAIQITKVAALLDKRFSELSDGQKQKVLIAKAIAQDTPILLLDEPTAHLDIHHRMEVFLILKELAHKYGKTILIATHEIGLATKLADALWLLNNGKIESGSPKKLIDSNSISKVFDSELIRFDAKTSTFEYKTKKQ